MSTGRNPQGRVDRRRFIAAASASMLTPAMAMAADSWPARQVSWVSISAPGGNSDVVSRIVAQALAEKVSKPVVVENRPGASGGVGSAHVARSAADGHTLLAGSIASHVIYPLIAKAAFDAEKDFVPVTVLGSSANVLVVPASSPYRTLQDLLKAAKQDPGVLSFASPGLGTTQHMSGELLQSLAKLKLVHVPNPRGSVLTDVMAGHITMMFEGFSAVPHVQGGKLRALAVTSKARWDLLPDVPTAAEAGLDGLEVSSWQALYAPSATPIATVHAVHREVRAALRSASVIHSFKQVGLEPGGMDPEAAAAYQEAERRKWARVVRDNAIRAW